MSQCGALSPKEVPMLDGVPKTCPCESVPFCSCQLPLPHYHSGMPAFFYPQLLHSLPPPFLLSPSHTPFKYGSYAFYACHCRNTKAQLITFIYVYFHFGLITRNVYLYYPFYVHLNFKSDTTRDVKNICNLLLRNANSSFNTICTVQLFVCSFYTCYWFTYAYPQ